MVDEIRKDTTSKNMPKMKSEWKGPKDYTYVISPKNINICYYQLTHKKFKVSGCHYLKGGIFSPPRGWVPIEQECIQSMIQWDQSSIYIICGVRVEAVKGSRVF